MRILMMYNRIFTFSIPINSNGKKYYLATTKNKSLKLCVTYSQEKVKIMQLLVLYLYKSKREGCTCLCPGAMAGTLVR